MVLDVALKGFDILKKTFQARKRIKAKYGKVKPGQALIEALGKKKPIEGEGLESPPTKGTGISSERENWLGQESNSNNSNNSKMDFKKPVSVFGLFTVPMWGALAGGGVIAYMLYRKMSRRR